MKLTKKIRQLYPDADSDRCADILHDWLHQLAEEAEQREDTPCIEYPNEYYTERA